MTSAVATGTLAAAAAARGGSNIESPAPTSVSAKRGRKRSSSVGDGEYKRLKTLPGGRNGTAALSPGFEVATNHHSGGASPLSTVASTAGGERKCAGSGSSSSKANSSSGSSSGKDAKSSSAPADAAGAVGGATAAGAATSSAGENGECEGTAATAAASRQHRVMELHKVKRKAVGAALARSALSRLQFITWEDVNVDWCPVERLTEAERRCSGLLEISALGVGARARDSGGRSTCSRAGDAVVPLAAGAVGGAVETEVGAGSPPPNEEAELRMGDLFPLPPPRPPRYVKKGVLAVDPGAAATPAASELPPAAPSPPRPNDVKPEDEASEGSRRVGGEGEPLTGNGSSKAGAAETDSNNSDDHSASTSATAAEANTTQYAMSAAARMKAYKGIFRTGGDKLKKRPRSPVASTPLHLPFPTAPGGGSVGGASLASVDLEERPPCGTEEYPQTEFGSEWAWGLLGGLQDGDGGGVDRGVGAAEGVGSSNGGHDGGAGEQGRGGGPRQGDFRLPYEVIYDCHNQEFLGEMRQLGMRSAEDAMGEFKGITSNVYLSKKVSEPRGHACFQRVCPYPPWRRPFSFVSDLHNITLQLFRFLSRGVRSAQGEVVICEPRFVKKSQTASPVYFLCVFGRRRNAVVPNLLQVHTCRDYA